MFPAIRKFRPVLLNDLVGFHNKSRPNLVINIVFVTLRRQSAMSLYHSLPGIPSDLRLLAAIWALFLLIYLGC